jgi:hypothetical protein
MYGSRFLLVIPYLQDGFLDYPRLELAETLVIVDLNLI